MTQTPPGSELDKTPKASAVRREQERRWSTLGPTVLLVGCTVVFLMLLGIAVLAWVHLAIRHNPRMFGACAAFLVFLGLFLVWAGSFGVKAAERASSGQKGRTPWTTAYSRVSALVTAVGFVLTVGTIVIGIFAGLLLRRP